MNKIIPIDIYNTDVMVHFGDYDSLKEELTARFGLEDAISILNGMNINSIMLGKTVLLSARNIILWMPSIPTPTKPVFPEQMERRIVADFNKSQPHMANMVVAVHIMRN